MQKKIKKYLILLCILGGLALPEIGWTATHAARALPPISGAESVQVQVTSTDNTITMDYSVPRATISSLGEQSPCPQGTCTKERIITGNARQWEREGQPVVPVIPSTIMLPAGKIIGNIEVTRSGEIDYSNEHFIEFGGKEIPISCTDCVVEAEPDNAIYNSNNAFPGTPYELVTVQKKHGVSIVYINLFPVTYYPLSGKVVSYETISLNVNLIESAQTNWTVACRPERVNVKTMSIENPNALDTYTPGYCQQVQETLPTEGICNSAETYKYVIITTIGLRDANPEYPLSELVNWRTGPCGLSVKVVTIDGADGIYENYTGSEAPDDPIDKIRSFIRDAYNNWKTEYVLIIGDPNLNTNGIVPMRWLWGWDPELNYATTVCSDLYFQCLDGPYNPDGDEFWGEDSFHGDGNVDLIADVFIGRAYVENAELMSNFIYKTITYETAVLNNDISFVNNALMPGEWLNTQPNGEENYAKKYLELIRFGTDAPKTFGLTCSPYYVNTYGLYEADAGYSKQDIKDLINGNTYGIISQMGHGNKYCFMKLDIRAPYHDIDDLTNTKLPFLYTMACLVGQPADNDGNVSMGEQITTKTKNGVWGAVLNTHYGIYAFYTDGGPSPGYNREFWDAYFYEGLLHLGAIFTDSHEDYVWNLNSTNWRWVYYCNNLFGDPYTQLIDPIPCEHTFNMGQFTGYHDRLARKLLSAGGNNGTVNILSGAKVTYMSGKEIHMFPNHNINSGAEFKASIDISLYKSICD